MKLTTKGRYAVMAMADLALFRDKGPINLTDISLRQNISLAYLEQIFIKLKKNSEITIYTDSKYVKDGITDWIKKWRLNNWKSASKKPVKNKDLWVKLDDTCKKHKINWKWVKAHAGNKMNNLVDKLAVLKTK